MKNPIYLEDIVISLQKSLSRVSQQTGRFRKSDAAPVNDADKTCSYLTGDVQFSMTIPVRPAQRIVEHINAIDAQNMDALEYSEGSEFRLTLNGTIHHDIRLVDESAKDGSGGLNG